MARNIYPDTCYKCGQLVPPGYGFFERIYDWHERKALNKGWRVQCVKCADGRTVSADERIVKRCQKEYEKRTKGECNVL